MTETLIWAYKPLAELDGQTGFVACSQDLANKLIASGDVQDPAVGGFDLKEIETGEYARKDMAAEKRRGRPSKAEDSEEK